MKYIYKKIQILTKICISILFSISILNYLPYQHAQAHFDHIAHYNSGGIGIENKYYINEQVDPEYTRPNELSKIQFSVQDVNGHDVYNIVVMVEIYSTLTGQRVSVFPWTNLSVGDFEVPFVFPKSGNYQIVFSLLNQNVNSSEIINTIPPQRDILGANGNCSCERAVFNVSVTQNFGTIFTAIVFISVSALIIVLAVTLIWIYLSRRKTKSKYSISNNDFIKYSILFLALGAAVIHLIVYADHAGLRLEYSYFLLAASGGQIVYGVMYLLLIFSNNSSNLDSEDKSKISSATTKWLIARDYYRKSLIINWFGLAGSMILIMLYLYVIIYPPPLSPNAHPEDVDLAGVIDKSLEILLVIGIIYLMIYERKRYLSNFKKPSFKPIK